MKVAIVGQGAMGSLFTSYYLQALKHKKLNNKVKQSVLAPTVLIRSLKPATKSIISMSGKKERLSVCFDNIKAPLHQDFDIVFIAIKNYQIPTFIDNITPWLTTKSHLVLIQNGMGGGERLKSAFPENTLIVGTSTDGVFKVNDSTYQMTASGQIDIGLFNTPKTISDNAIKETLQVLSGWHPNVIVHKNIQVALFTKLAINAVINPLTGILNIKNGQLFDYPKEVNAIKQEIFSVYRAMNTGIDEVSLSSTINDVIANTASNYSSMHQDMHYKRQTEIDGILGFLIEQAEEFSVDVPDIKRLYRLVNVESHA